MRANFLIIQVANNPGLVEFQLHHQGKFFYHKRSLSDAIFQWVNHLLPMKHLLVGGWAYPSEKYDFVSWDDEIPNWMENKSHVPNHQAVYKMVWFIFHVSFIVTFSIAMWNILKLPEASLRGKNCTEVGIQLVLAVPATVEQTRGYDLNPILSPMMVDVPLDYYIKNPVQSSWIPIKPQFWMVKSLHL